MKSNDPGFPFRLEFDPRLVEEAVLLRMNDDSKEREFRQSRSGIYELDGDEERDAHFDQFHKRWFMRLNLDQGVLKALAEQPVLMRETRGCRVMLAILRKMEGADLYDESHGSILLRLRPGSLLDVPALVAFLRHEFMHLVDMLDPCFGYQSKLPPSDAGPSYDNLIRQRYRVLWDTWIDGRLLRRGWAPDGIREKRLAEFRATFSMLGEAAQARFSDWFDGPLHTHQELVSFAQCPESAGPLRTAPSSRIGRCPLCRFPCFDLQSALHLPSETVREISIDFPEWGTRQGLCRQCQELYQSRELSRLAEAVLPGR